MWENCEFSTAFNVENMENFLAKTLDFLEKNEFAGCFQR